MSTADFAKFAYGLAPSADEALLTRIVNEISLRPISPTLRPADWGSAQAR